MILEHLPVIWETVGVVARRKGIALLKVCKDKMIDLATGGAWSPEPL